MARVSPKMMRLGFVLMLLLALVEGAPPGLAKEPKKVKCNNTKYKECHNLEHVCPKFCPDTCTVDCRSCKPICGADSTPDTGSTPYTPPTPTTPAPTPPTPTPPTPSPTTPAPTPPTPTPPTPAPTPPTPTPPTPAPTTPTPTPPTPTPPTPTYPTPPTPTPPTPAPTPPTPSPPTETPPTPTPPTPAPTPPTPSPPIETPPTPTPPTPAPTPPTPSPPIETPPTPTPPTPAPTPPTPSPPIETPPTPTPPTPAPTPPTPSPPIETPPKPTPQTPPTSPTPAPTPPTETPPTPTPPTPTPAPTPPTPSPPTETPPTPTPPVETPPTPAPPTETPPTSSTPSPDASAQKRVRCKNRSYGHCYGQEHVCPASCPTTCEVDCITCKPLCKCDFPGTVCQDPRFIGADGITFYFHGKKDRDFCLVTDRNLQINAHFIGKRGPNMSRDFTWVQSLGILFDEHRLFVGAQRTATWDDSVDRLALSFNNEPIFLNTTEGASWRSTTSPRLSITRIASDTNSIELEVEERFKIKAKVVHITKKDSAVHNYGITSDDCFAHLDLSFKFFSLSSDVEGVLGKTYRSDYVSKVNMGASMPVVGGEREYETSGLFSPDCKASRFVQGAASKRDHGLFGLGLKEIKSLLVCASGIDGAGVVCKR